MITKYVTKNSNNCASVHVLGIPTFVFSNVYSMQVKLVNILT